MGAAKSNLTVWQTYLTEATYAPSDGYGRMFCSIQNRTISGDSMITLPIISPFGVLSVPKPTSNAMGINISGVGYNPAIMGVVVPSDESEEKDPFSDPQPGEVIVYSDNYQVRVHNDNIKVNLKNAQMDEEANLINGDWAAKMINDLLGQVEDLYQKLAVVEANYDSHFHLANGSPTSISNNTIDFGFISDQISSDSGAINNGEVYLDDKSSPPSGGV